MSRHFATSVVLLLLCGCRMLFAQEIKQEFVSSGITKRLGGYSPQRAVMDQEAGIVSAAPEELAAPRYGWIEIGDRKWAFILDEPEDQPARLFLDSNADGDLTNDPETTWEPQERDGLVMYQGSGEVQLGDGRSGVVNMYRFDPRDERRAALKDTLLFYGDYGFELTIDLEGQQFSTLVAGDPSAVKGLSLDRDGNGQISSHFERVRVGEPFNFTGNAWVFEVVDGKLTLNRSEADIPQMPMPPDLRIGSPALQFTARDMDGKEINFPGDYAGKLVMLDFWATWCGPCIAEIPNVKQAYADWHDQGFEILGVSFDREGEEEKVREFLAERELPWPQIYEGKGWETTIGIQYDVSGIPFVLLVDGDTGRIVATVRQLRGPKLSSFIGKQLELKHNGGAETADGPPADSDGSGDGGR